MSSLELTEITVVRCSVSSSGRPAAGSSSRTSRGLPATALATSTRRRCPTVSEPTLTHGVTPPPTYAIDARMSSLRAEPRSLE